MSDKNWAKISDLVRNFQNKKRLYLAIDLKTEFEKNCVFAKELLRGEWGYAIGYLLKKQIW